MKSPSLRKLEEKLWTVFSLWIRKRHADKDGYVACYTCGVRKHYKELQAGHYIKRARKILKFDERNVKPQCVACNLYRDGNQDAFAEHLELDYGHGILQEFGKLKWQEKRWTRQELEDLITHYKSLSVEKIL